MLKTYQKPFSGGIVVEFTSSRFNFCRWNFSNNSPPLFIAGGCVIFAACIELQIETQS